MPENLMSIEWVVLESKYPGCRAGWDSSILWFITSLVSHQERHSKLGQMFGMFIVLELGVTPQ